MLGERGLTGRFRPIAWLIVTVGIALVIVMQAWVLVQIGVQARENGELAARHDYEMRRVVAAVTACWADGVKEHHQLMRCVDRRLDAVKERGGDGGHGHR